MLIHTVTAKCIGIEAIPITVEVNISNGIGIHLVGLADAAVKESLLRTVTALQTLGFHIPGKKIVINLAPADLHKNGSGYDVPIALGIIAASGQAEATALSDFVISGELGLDGSVRNVPGALPITEMAYNNGFKACILPYCAALETAGFYKDFVYGVHTLADVVDIVTGKIGYERFLVNAGNITTVPTNGTEVGEDIMDFSEITGQETAKRGLEIAASGGHNIIMVGPPGSGKSSLAKALCGIMPPMDIKETFQTCKIYSVSGKWDLGSGQVFRRPFRAPHNTVSIPALIGGGSSDIVPGEISLAHNGVLFLDEFLEFPSKTLELLRGPMEDRRIVLSRLRSKVTYPSDFTLVAATNPCPCGYYGEGDRCNCTVGQRMSYLGKLSGPVSDRLDLQIWLHPVSPETLMGSAAAMEKRPDSSAEIAARVRKARDIQHQRLSSEGISCNAQMNNRQIKSFCPLDKESRAFLEKAMTRMGFSARVGLKIIKIARTIADMESSEDIRKEHLAEAVSYRFMDKQGY